MALERGGPSRIAIISSPCDVVVRALQRLANGDTLVAIARTFGGKRNRRAYIRSRPARGGQSDHFTLNCVPLRLYKIRPSG
jgi:hypothetical protein